MRYLIPVLLACNVLPLHADDTKVTRGWLVQVHKYKSFEEVGSKVGTMPVKLQLDPYHLDMHRRALPEVKGPVSYVFEGYYKVKKSGQHTFIAGITLPPPDAFPDRGSLSDKRLYSQCGYTLTLNNKVLINEKTPKYSDIQAKESFYTAIAALKADSTYKIKQQWNCFSSRVKAPDHSLTQKNILNGNGLDLDRNPYDEFGLLLRVKAPNKPNAAPIKDVFYKVGG